MIDNLFHTFLVLIIYYSTVGIYKLSTKSPVEFGLIVRFSWLTSTAGFLISGLARIWL